MWNIEKIVKKGDYDYAVVKGHPNATKHGYVLHHRIIMENHLGRLLDASEIVHHVDGNKKNNCIDNLELTCQSEHARRHSSTGRKMCILKCPQCGEEFHRERSQTFLSKNTRYTCCSSSCRGKFSRFIQLNGITHEVETAISENLVSEYRSHDNSEVTKDN